MSRSVVTHVCPIRSGSFSEEVPLNWNKWVRQTHRWLSIAFTVTVIANFVALAQGEGCPALGDLLAAAPARLAPVHRSVLVRAAVCHQVAQRATHRLFTSRRYSISSRSRDVGAGALPPGCLQRRHDRRARDERPLRAGGSDVEPRRTGMVRREVRGDVEDRAVRGRSRSSMGHRVRRTPRILPTYPLDTGIRPESNTCSGGPGEVPDGEVNAHLGNPG